MDEIYGKQDNDEYIKKKCIFQCIIGVKILFCNTRTNRKNKFYVSIYNLDATTRSINSNVKGV
jgi:hypothetical protein